MERWAKNVNAAKAAQKQQLQALIQLERAEAVTRETEDQPQQQLSLVSPSNTVKKSGISLSAALEVLTELLYMYLYIINVRTCAYIYVH